MSGELKAELTRLAADALQSPKVAVGVALTTSATGTGTIYDWIPNNIGPLASALGVVLTAILVISNIDKMIRERRSSELNDQRLELEISRLKSLKDKPTN